MASLKDRLQQILLQHKLVSPENLDKALKQQEQEGGELSKILIKLNLIDEETLIPVLSEAMEVPLIHISRLHIDPEVVKIVPQDVAQKYQVIPVSLLGDHLTVAMADPLNIFAVDNLKALTGYTIIPVIGREEEIRLAISRHYGIEDTGTATGKFKEIIKDIQDTGDIELVKEAGHHDPKAVEELADDAPIIKLTDTIIQQAAFAKASDVFIEPMEKTLRIRYRIDGMIREIDRMAKFLHAPIISRIKVISNLDISEHRLPQDGRFKTIISGKIEVDFRVSVLPTPFGEKIVLRVLDQQGTVLDVDNLGFDPESLRRLKECSFRPHGMILTCGPTGSGKTTTLYSILKYIDSPEKNIVTVEDPVEYQLKGANQVNVRPAIGLTFPACLRSILRQDPNVILIGEIRDTETLDIAVKAALTGHLVLSSLHTTTAAGSVVRMMNMGIEPFLICSSVLAVVAQRLLRRLCPHCKEYYTLSKEIVAKVGLAKIVSQDTVVLFRAKGCPQCFNTGYRGRVGITEIMVLSIRLKELILQKVGEGKIKHVARQEGMKTMREDGLKKAMEGLTSLEEVLRVTAPDEEES
ncbi:MAG: Flp pilus assembly complex ATPase component TadA [Candidatus Omnitrophica bacterium]|nr:Flp pilus assembly complex ATPase component TadA [Candidatus Omnitrophota bacterium]